MISSLAGCSRVYIDRAERRMKKKNDPVLLGCIYARAYPFRMHFIKSFKFRFVLLARGVTRDNGGVVSRRRICRSLEYRYASLALCFSLWLLI